MDQILKIEDAAMEAWRQGDPMKWTEISADEVIYLDPNLSAPIVGNADYIRYLEPIKGMVIYDASEYVKPQVAVYGDTAILTYNYHSLRKDQGGKLSRTSFWNTTEVYRKILGNWKIAHTHWSYLQHHLPERPEAQAPDTAKTDVGLTGTAAEIMRMEAGAREMWRKGDLGGYLGLCVPEATYFDDKTAGRLNGIREMKNEFDRLREKTLYDSIEYRKPHVLVFEDSAILFYQFIAIRLEADGSPKSREPWNCTAVYAKTAGGWKIVHSHWSYVKGTREGGGI